MHIGLDSHVDQASLRESARRAIVRLVFIVLFLLLFEGVLRKWLIPDLQRLLYFIRDPFVILIYVYALAYGMLPRNSVLIIALLFAVPVAIFHLMMALSGIGHPLAWALGVRHYFFYLPLAFVMGYCLRFEDVAIIVRFSLIASIPISILAFIQHQAPPSAVVNRGLPGGAEGVRVAGDVLRPFGVFPYTAPHVWYTAATIAVVALAWPSRRRFHLSWPLLLCSTMATSVMALTTGSRAIWFYSFSIVLFAMLATCSSGRGQINFRIAGFAILFALTSVALYSTFLDPALQAMIERHDRAVQNEGDIISRAFGHVTGPFEVALDAPIQGYGLGMGMSGAAAAITGERAFSLAETEWSDVVLELGPVLGIGFILLRLYIVSWLLYRCVAANVLCGNPAGLILFGFVGLFLLLGQLTRSGTGASFGWCLAGLLLAMTDPRRSDDPDAYPKS